MNENCHNRLITVMTPDVSDAFPTDGVPLNLRSEVLGCSFIDMMDKDFDSLKHSDNSTRVTTFIVKNVPDEIPMDAVPVKWSDEEHAPIIVEQTMHKPSTMPMVINNKLINVPQPNMLPSITEYDNDKVDVNDDPCNCCDCYGSNECYMCSHGPLPEFEPYNTDEPIYPQVVERTNLFLDTLPP